MLVDGGGFPTFKGGSVRRMDIGEQVVSPYLWTRGLRRLDIVAMTHAHDDHAQGLSAVIRNFRPSEFWTGAVPAASSGLLSEARNYGAQLRQPHAGDVRKFGAATVRVLAPAADYIPSASAKNNDSLVLEITYGNRRFLLTGDAEKAVELDLVNREALRHAGCVEGGTPWQQNLNSCGSAGRRATNVCGDFVGRREPLQPSASGRARPTS